MAAPPPPHLLEHDAGRSRAPAATSRRRTRLKLALASIPLVLAVILLLVKAVGGSGGPDDAASSGGLESEQAGAATGAAGEVAVAAVQEGRRQAAAGGAVSGEAAAGGTVLDETVGRPVTPAGHRAVAVRFASPDAVNLVAAGDRIDIVSADGSVLEANVEVLQDRSTDLATVLVLAVTGERAADVAATAVNQDLTLLVAPTPE
ncbi:hypothetical protein F7P69_13420 [Cellulosimicrobium funkei]|nr:hypothetical protein [Cellulosimicrobium funkei]